MALTVQAILQEHFEALAQTHPLAPYQRAAAEALQLDLPIQLDNGMQALALAELWFGAGQNIPTLLVSCLVQVLPPGLSSIDNSIVA